MIFKIIIVTAVVTNTRVLTTETKISNNNNQQLINLVKLINAQTNQDAGLLMHQRLVNELDRQETLPNLNKRLTKDKGTRIQLKDIMRLLQNNYDANDRRLEINDFDNEPRLIVISNPEALEKYQRGSKPNFQSSSSASSLTSSSDESIYVIPRLKGILQDMRRNTMIPPSDAEDFLLLRRQNNNYQKSKTGNYNSFDEADVSETVYKKKKNTDLYKAFDRAANSKNNLGLKKRPVEDRFSNSKMNVYEYKPRKDYFNKKDYRSYGRTSVPISGNHYTGGRKYDIESEAMKLYGEDFASVLRRFRKSPEYLSILKTKLAELMAHYEYISADLHSYYYNKMKKKIKNIFVANQTESQIDDRKRKILRGHRAGYRKQTDEKEESANKTGVEILDSYKKLQSYLTIEEKNMCKDVGFETAGTIIHEIIKAISDDDGQGSTLVPYGDDEKNYSIHDHQVTHASKATDKNIPHGHSTAAPESYRHFKPHNIL